MSFSLVYKNELMQTIDSIDLAKVEEAISWLREARSKGRTIFTAGNGGSAATASHFVCDMVKGASYGRQLRFRVLCLNDNLPTITAYSNDVGYDAAIAEQLRNFVQPGDIFVAISGSGNSPNVVAAMETANAAGCRTIALTGRDGGKLGRLAQLEINVRAPHMGRIEDAHMIVCHMIGYCFMEETEEATGCCG